MTIWWLPGILAALVGVVTSQISTTTTQAPGTPWHKEDIPNPQRDVNSCGRGGKASWVCDPDGALTPEEADRIDSVLAEMRGGEWDCVCEDSDDCPPGYGGVQAAVVILNRLADMPTRPKSGEKKEIAEDYADYLRDDEWEFGKCNDDLVLLVSKLDRVVFTKTGDSISAILTDGCVDQIFKENKEIFTLDDFGLGIYKLLEQYKAVFAGDRSCSSNVAVIVLAVIGGGLVIAVVTCLICRRTGRCKGKGGGGGGEGGSSSHATAGYTTASTAAYCSTAQSEGHIGGHTGGHIGGGHSSRHSSPSRHNSPVRHSSPSRHSVSSASSASSGGGGGEF